MRWVLAALTLGALAASSCSSTRDLPSVTTARPSTTIVDNSGELPRDTVAPSVAIQDLEVLIARLLASNDSCAILTQRDVRENQLDPGLFDDPAARRVLADGLVQIFDHLVTISPPSIHDSLRDQKDIYADVLAVVDEYAADPENTEATAEIEGLLDQPRFLLAQNEINRFIEQVCI